MGVYRSQAMLNMIHADIFPLLPHQTLSEQQQHNLYRLSPVELPAIWRDQPNITIGETNLRYPLRSQGGFQNESCIKLDNKIFQDEVTSQKDFSQAFSELQDKLKVMDRGLFESFLFNCSNYSALFSRVPGCHSDIQTLQCFGKKF